MKRILLLLFIIAPLQGFTQNYQFSSGEISFFAEASVEDIAAKSYQIESSFDPTTGKISFQVPIKSFVFKKSLMKEHFNDKYAESDKYPTATFQGVVKGFAKDNTGLQKVTATGDMTIHGVKRQISIEGTLERELNDLKLEADFIARFEDYKIKVPKLFWRSVAEEVEVKAKISYKAN